MKNNRNLHVFLGRTALYFVILLGLLYFCTLVRAKAPLFIMSSSLKEKRNASNRIKDMIEND